MLALYIDLYIIGNDLIVRINNNFIRMYIYALRMINILAIGSFHILNSSCFIQEIIMSPFTISGIGAINQASTLLQINITGFNITFRLGGKKLLSALVYSYFTQSLEVSCILMINNLITKNGNRQRRLSYRRCIGFSALLLF